MKPPISRLCGRAPCHNPSPLAAGGDRDVIIALNLSEHTLPNHQLGLPRPGRWEEAFNSDIYDNWVKPWRQGNGGGVFANGGAMRDFPQSARVTLTANYIDVFAS